MKKISFVLCIAVSAFTFTSCKKEINGSGHYVSQNRFVGSFDAVQSSGDFNVVLVPDSANHLELYGEDNILPELKTEVYGNQLRIYFDHSNYNYDYGNLTVTVYSPAITNVDLQGSGKISSTDTLFSNLDANISGSGEIDLTMDNNKVTSRISGSGKISLYGYSQISNHTISGSGNIHALNLISSDVTAVISGSGNCHVYATDYLHVTISGSGNVYYLGHPEIHTSISGSGNVIPE